MINSLYHYHCTTISRIDQLLVVRILNDLCYVPILKSMNLLVFGQNSVERLSSCH